VGKPSAQVAEAWQSWINANGGIGGRPVQIIVKNSAGDGATLISAVQEFVQTDKVAAVMINDDTAEPAAGNFLVSNNIPVIGASGFTTTLWSAKPNYKTIVTQIPATLEAQAVVAKAVGVKNFGTVVCQEVAACKQAEALFKPAATALGLNYTGLVTASASAPNYSAQCLALKQKSTDFISFGVTTPVGVRFAKDCNRQGYVGYYGVNAGSFNQSEDARLPASTKIAGNLQAFPWWIDAPPVQQFRDAMKQYQPTADYRSGESTAVWTSLQLFRKALGSTVPADVTPAVVDADYAKVSNETLDGLLPQAMSYPAGQPAASIKCFWLYTYRAGAQNPTIIPPTTTSGNGASGELASTCAS
jgi:branched-chain amino acid transport system substrate-binding protein